MKDKHAQTHAFTIIISRGSATLNAIDALPIENFERNYDCKVKGKVPNIFDKIPDTYDDNGDLVPFDLWYVTPDYMDAIFALFVLVKKEIIDICDANEAAMKFTETFYGEEE